MSGLRGRRILVVDDERFMRTTIKSMLRAAGYFNVDEAADGAAALSTIDVFRPHLVLCDVAMSPMGGIEFVEKLRCHTDEARRGTRVIMLTANANEETVHLAKRLQLDGYLLKPVSSKQLGALVGTVLGRDSESDISG
jgi:CheY-like chemotaxis protein